MNTLTVSKYTLSGLMLVTLAALAGVANVALAQMPGDLEVSARNMTATATFVRSTPCATYTLDWGDGQQDEMLEESEVCIEVIDEETLRHTYEEEGEYTVTLTLGDNEFTEEITVPNILPEFALEDVATVTSEWVDPDQMMADEEYYIYTITLENGETVAVEVPGFTLEEYRVQQFRDAGYTGDIAELIDMAESVEAETEAEAEPEAPAATTVGIYQQLVTAMQSLVERLQQLLQLQK